MLKNHVFSTLRFLVFFAVRLSLGLTDPGDVSAINSLYAALGSPLLPGWISLGGDPCLEGWQGVQCVGSNITAIILNGANLGGQLGDKLDSFSSIITIDLSNNHIGESIPENLPVTMRRFFLSSNKFTGSIPSSLSGLTLLSDMSLNENNLSGELPDAFQPLTGLINLDLSNNSIKGQLPPSMAGLLSLTTLHVQNNQISGTLDVLQDTPLKDLNIENNLFSGPIPANLLNIPVFKKDGNPFNTTPAPSASPSILSPPPTEAPVSETTPARSSDGPVQASSHPEKKTFTTTKIVACAIASLIAVIVFVLLVAFCVSKRQERKSRHDNFIERHDDRAYSLFKDPKMSKQPNDEVKKAFLTESGIEKQKQLENGPRVAVSGVSVKENKEHNMVVPFASEKVIVNPKLPSENNTHTSFPAIRKPPVEEAATLPINPIKDAAGNPTHSMPSFSVASLQEYTNSFSEENLIAYGGRFGKLYLAELPGEKLLAVVKLDKICVRISVDEFLELVSSISKLQHPNIIELVGYCAEFEQRLLIYNYYGPNSLHDLLHCGDGPKNRLSWNARLKIALDAAKALEYLHELSRPAVIHKNFESANVLVDDSLNVRIFECGLSPLMSSDSITQLSVRMQATYSYEAPEVHECGFYTDKSDIYSFGVVMLELLTGRRPFDSSRPRVEQHLVRWASSQLHDINTLSRMVDPSISGRCPEKSLSRFADIISRCIQQGPEFRPPMSEVVQDLNLMVEESRGTNPGRDQY